MTARALLAVLLLAATAPGTEPPRFTPEREAAALHFVKKHCPELTPLLDDLKKSNRAAYELQVRETFQVTELLADVQDDATRHDLELKTWKAENKALLLVAKLAAPTDDRKAVEEQLRALAKELTALEVKSLEHRVGVLERELTAAKDDLAKARDGADRTAKERFDSLLDKGKKKKG